MENQWKYHLHGEPIKRLAFYDETFNISLTSAQERVYKCAIKPLQ